MPAHSTTRLTFFAVAVESGISAWKLPLANSSSVDTASLWRSSDLGVITTSGLRVDISICRRIMWKSCAGVVGAHTIMLSSAHSCRKRSSRAETVLGALSFVPMRQEQRQAAQPIPLGFARRQELVDHHLRAVGEVAELRFPDVQRQRVGGRVAVFEAHDGFLAEQRVDDGDRLRVLHQLAQRQVVLVGLLVVQDRVAMEERAAAGILADQAQLESPFEAAVDQRRVGEVLGEAPVGRQFAGGHLAAVFVDLRHARVQDDVVGDRVDLRGERVEALAIDSRIDRIRQLAVVLRPVDREFAGLTETTSAVTSPASSLLR